MSFVHLFFFTLPFYKIPLIRSPPKLPKPPTHLTTFSGVITITDTIASVMLAWAFHVLKS